MASVDPRTADIVAHLPGVKAAVRSTADRGGERARGILAGHRHDGHARIEVDRSGFVDALVILNDDRGQSAAMTIEFGRVGGNLDVNGRVVSPMAPVAPLRKAFGI